MDDLFQKEDTIFGYEEAFEECKDRVLCQLAQLDDDEVEKRETLETTFTTYCEKVENHLNELVKFPS